MQEKYSRRYLVDTAIGLQDVDGIKNSEYFLKLSEQYVAGKISIRRFSDLIDKYYEKKEKREDRSDEADKVSKNMIDLLSNDNFVFSIGQLQTIHKELFTGVIDNAGLFRTYNIEKKEWVLNGDTVIYGDYRELHDLLSFDFESEKNFDYSKLNMDEKIVHLANFVSNIWQAHAFPEGNTRTTSTFFIKYLRKLGFDVTNDLFKQNSWYFRNALVRANYSNFPKNIYEDKQYVVRFLRNLLLNENNKLSNRELNVSYVSDAQEILSKLNPTQKMILDLLKNNKGIKVSDVAKYLNISLRTAESQISKLKELGIIERIDGKKYGYWEVKK
ncbi:MAG: Fic family protein [Bacilli bacterium]|nr:Fic family protein [Bacilli bacterium]